MIAAVYARKSTDQHVTDEQKSVARQIDHAHAYAARRGWTIDDAHVYVDDGISGAEFASRPGFMRLMTALTPRAPFTVLIMSESSRLGREQFATGYALKQLSQAGVRCFSYLDDREIVLDTATDKFMMSAATFADDLEREKARQRVTDTMRRKALAGHVTGGRVFGYTNHEVIGPDGKRSHVERVRHDEEAAIVRRIFELSATGTGFTRIAKLLNEEGAACPRPAPGRPAGWAPTSVRAIVLRPLYRGEVVYNTTRKKDPWGQRKTSDRPEHEWIRSHAEALRIVSDDLWHRAQARLAGIRTQLGTSRGGSRSAAVRRRDIDSSYLLSGFARCAVCGGAFCVMNHTMYGCMAHHKRGSRVCANGLRLPMDRVDGAVLTKLEEVLDDLNPRRVLGRIVDDLRALCDPRTRAMEAKQARARLVTVEREIANIRRAIAHGGDRESLELLMQDLQQGVVRRRDLLAVIAAGDTAPDLQAIEQVEQDVREGLDAWRALVVSDDVVGGREFMRRALDRPLLFTPDGRAYQFDGAIAHGRLIAGRVGEPLQLEWRARGGSPQVATMKFSGIAA